MSHPEDDPIERLAENIGTCYFSDLRAHVDRDVVIVVANDLDLLDVARAVARDEAETVRGFIAAEKLRKPSMEQIQRWKSDDRLTFRSVIVRPYVLVQTLTN